MKENRAIDQLNRCDNGVKLDPKIVGDGENSCAGGEPREKLLVVIMDEKRPQFFTNNGVLKFMSNMSWAISVLTVSQIILSF